MFLNRGGNSSLGRVLVVAGIVLLAYAYMNNQQQRQMVEKMQAQLLAKERQEQPRADTKGNAAANQELHIATPSAPPPSPPSKEVELVFDDEPKVEPAGKEAAPAPPAPAPGPPPASYKEAPAAVPTPVFDGDTSIPYATLGPPDPDDPLERYNIARDQEYPVEETKGLEDLRRFGLTVPAVAFDYDGSPEAQAARFKEQVDEMVAQGMPETHARLRAQLAERELQDKAQRAKDTRRRAIIRLRQEVKLRKDAQERKERLAVLEAKQQMVQEMLERGQAEKERAAAAKKERQKQMEEEAQRQKDEADALRQFREQTRLEQLAKFEKENQRRRDQLAKEKEEEKAARELAAKEEKESKRLMMEEFQAMRNQQMEESKRLAREERLAEMQAAAELRKQQQEELGLA